MTDWANASLHDAYERGRQDERRAVVAYLLTHEYCSPSDNASALERGEHLAGEKP